MRERAKVTVNHVTIDNSHEDLPLTVQMRLNKQKLTRVRCMLFDTRQRCKNRALLDFLTRPSALTRVDARDLHCRQWYFCSASTRAV
jgi:hypothetical protein